MTRRGLPGRTAWNGSKESIPQRAALQTSSHESGSSQGTGLKGVPLKGKVQIREEVGAGAGGTLQPDPGLTVALGYEKHIYITFSGTTKA